MDISIYPIVIFLCIVIFYFFGGNKKTKNEDLNLKTMTTPIKNFAVETEDEFNERCYIFLKEWLIQNEIAFYVSSDKTSFKIGYEDNDGLTVDHFLDTFYSPNKKIIMFHTEINQHIPDNKLTDISEFVNRLNHKLLIGSLYLNYETRKIENRLVYYVGNSELDKEQLEFNYGMLLSLKIKHSLLKIIHNNENPALVALDWPN